MNSTRQTISLDQLISKQLDIYYSLFGKTELLARLNFILPIVTGSLGCLANLLCFYIYQAHRRDKFSLPMFDYIRVHCLNSLMVNFFSIFVFVNTSTRYIAWTNSFSALMFYVLDFHFIQLGYFYGTALDLLVITERISAFSPRLKQLLTTKFPSPYKLSLIALFAVIIINWAYYTANVPAKATLNLVVNATSGQRVPYVIWYSGVTKFISYSPGKYFVYILFGFRDGFLMIVELSLNVTLVYLLHRHLRKKSKLLARSSISMRPDGSTANRIHPTANEPRGSQQIEKLESSSSMTRMVRMVSVMSLLSTLDHLLALARTSYAYSPYYNVVTFQLLTFFYLYMISLKHALNFAIFLVFNKNFYQCFQRILRKLY